MAGLPPAPPLRRRSRKPTSPTSPSSLVVRAFRPSDLPERRAGLRAWAGCFTHGDSGDPRSPRPWSGKGTLRPLRPKFGVHEIGQVVVAL